PSDGCPCSYRPTKSVKSRWRSPPPSNSSRMPMLHSLLVSGVDLRGPALDLTTLPEAVVRDQDDERPDDGRDEAGALTGPVEPDQATQEGGDERPSHAEECRHEEPSRIPARHDELRDGASHGPDDDDPDQLEHVVLPAFVFTSRQGMRSF